MATHSSTLAWKIPWMEESGRLQSMGSLRVGYDCLHFHFSLSCIGEGNGNLSSVLAWKFPWTEEPGGLQSMGSQRDVTEHTLSDKQKLCLIPTQAPTWQRILKYSFQKTQ